MTGIRATGAPGVDADVGGINLGGPATFLAAAHRFEAILQRDPVGVEVRQPR